MFKMISKLGKAARIATALALVGAIGVAVVTSDAQARTATCYRCTGGYCCY